MENQSPGVPLRRRISYIPGSAVLSDSLQEVPSTLLNGAAPCDVFPRYDTLARDPSQEEPAETLPRSHTSPADLSTLQGMLEIQRRRGSGSRWQLAWLVFIFVFLDVSKSFAVSWAAVHGNMCAPLVITTKNVLSIAFGMALAAGIDGKRGVRQCLQFDRTLKVFPVAGCFCAAQILNLQALRAFDAGSLKVIAQVNLPIIAVLSWLMLRRKYTLGQWFAILLLFTATVAFMQVRMLFFQPRGDVDDYGPLAPDKFACMVCFLGAIGFSCIGSILAEMFLKKRSEIPYCIQKTNLMFGELLAAYLLMHFSGDRECSMEQMQDWRQLPMILIWAAHGWTAGVLVKRCSVLVKNVSHILSALVTYFLPLLLISGTQHSWPVTLSACLVVAAVMVFASVPHGNSNGNSNGNGKSKGPPAPESTAPKEEPIAYSTAPPVGLQRSHSEANLNLSRLQPQRRLHELRSSTNPAPEFKLCAMLSSSVGVLLFAFVLLDATKPLLMSWAQQHKAPGERFHRTAFVLTQTAVSLIIGLIIAVRPTLSRGSIKLHYDWRTRLRRCASLRSAFNVLPVSFCLCMSKLFLVMALERLDAGTVRVFSQSSLPLVGIGTTLVFGRKYTFQQWCSLVAVTLALITFYHVKNEVQVKNIGSVEVTHTRIGMLGLLMIFGSIAFNCLGALLVEKFLKGRRAPLHEQKSQLLLGEVIVNACLLLGTPGVPMDLWHRGFFAGWDRRALICLLVWISAGWTTTILVKRCSNVLKTVAQASSSVLTYVFSICPVTLVGPPLTPEPISYTVVLLAVTVMLSALTFGTDSHSRGGQGGEKSGANRSLPPTGPGSFRRGTSAGTGRRPVRNRPRVPVPLVAAALCLVVAAVNVKMRPTPDFAGSAAPFWYETVASSLRPGSLDKFGVEERSPGLASESPPGSGARQRWRRRVRQGALGLALRRSELTAAAVAELTNWLALSDGTERAVVLVRDDAL